METGCGLSGLGSCESFRPSRCATDPICKANCGSTICLQGCEIQVEGLMSGHVIDDISVLEKYYGQMRLASATCLRA